MKLEELRKDEIDFSKKVALLSSVWITVTVGAGVALVLYQDAFTGVFF